MSCLTDPEAVNPTFTTLKVIPIRTDPAEENREKLRANTMVKKKKGKKSAKSSIAAKRKAAKKASRRKYLRQISKLGFGGPAPDTHGAGEGEP